MRRGILSTRTAAKAKRAREGRAAVTGSGGRDDILKRMDRAAQSYIEGSLRQAEQW